MSSAARVILVFIGVAITALAASGIPGAPEWVEVVLAALAAGFLGIGVVPPQLVRGRSSDTADVYVRRRNVG